MANLGHQTIFLFVILLTLPSACTKGPAKDDKGRPILDRAKILGIDSNGNGVRDDVEEWINATYPNSEKARAALMSSAKFTQQSLDETRDPFVTAKGDELSLFCLWAVLDRKEALKMSREIEARTVNTPERSEAYLRYNLSLSGHFFAEPNTGLEACDFDLSKMHN
jgi:hypothetical protein